MSLSTRITTQAQAVALGPAVRGFVLWTAAAPFYLVGWLAGQLVRGVVWLAAAAVVGYRDATTARPRSPEGQG